MADERLRYPQTCPHCGKSIAQLKPIGDRVLEVAIAVLNGCQTSRAVARELDITTAAASMALKSALESGLVRVVAREKLQASGGTQIRYAPAQRLAAFAFTSWKLYERDHKKKPA